MIRHILLGTMTLALMSISAAALAQETCLDCHRKQTPAAVEQWQNSAHGPVNVGCADCHGSDHERIVNGEAPVNAAVCGECHKEAFKEHSHSRHGMGLHSGWGCTRNLPDRDRSECSFCHEEGSTLPVSTVECSRFLKQTREIRELGCNRCHQVESSCASCHGNHVTDLAIVRDPNVCAKCHMGPDHPQWEMWQTSMHGTLYSSVGEELGPTCQRCHMPEGTHDVSKGLTATPGMATYPEDELEQRRRDMVGICVQCHSENFAATELARGDAIREQSLKLVEEAERIIWDLADRDLLDPMPRDRPPHPLRGNVLVTDSQMLYEDISHIERLFFKMKKYDLAKTVKGAYHQNPAYTHWYGNAELKMDLADIRSEASRLKRQAGLKSAPVDSSAGKQYRKAGQQKDKDIEKSLEVLKKKHGRGAISDEEYRRQKKVLLDKFSK
ncbi:MAG: hypothetical protein GWO11_08595 [Desulfuromonadales bacterium]|nr:hypothetical protein [Desulfuromonadales bacterium]NIR34355.1 hypothetical protein [Desulfuromonadales bacterium]NIS40415.1 hypothetical protein [Desulfuromonadales bacterium]